MRLIYIFLFIHSVESQAISFKSACDWFLRRPEKTGTFEKPQAAMEFRDDLSMIGKYRDSDWVMDEALRTFRELEKLPAEERHKKSIDYLRGQIPLLIDILQNLAPPKNVPYWMIDEEGKAFKNGVDTLDKAVQALIKEGREHYFKRDANLEWFPQYVLEVVGLRWFMRMHYGGKWQIPSVEKFHVWRKSLDERRREAGGALALMRDTPEWFLFHMMRDKRYLNEQRELGALHWPTIADLNVSHFRNWHLNIKPLGYSENGVARLDGSETDDFELYGHDIDAHDLPHNFVRYKDLFEQVVVSVEGKLKREKWDHQVLMKLMWFETTHEAAKLYEMFVHLMENPCWHIEYGVKEGLDEIIYIEGHPNHFADIIFYRLEGELTSYLRGLAPHQLATEINTVYPLFKSAVIQAFLDKKYK